MKSTKASPRRAVGVACIVLFLSACTFSIRSGDDEKNGAAKAVRENSVDVTALWFGQDTAGQATGGTSDVEITVEPSTDDEFKIAFVESEVLGSGDQWRSSQWTGSAVALLATGTDPDDVALEFAVDGRIDGPSAGALMTVGVAAALNGDEIDSSVTMTGTINPDGSVGPVGGIPQKIEGAAEADKTKVLIPAGTRMSQDKATGELVDSVERGESLGVQVQEVANVYDAYAEFTGEAMADLPDPVDQVVLGSEASSRLEAATEEWLDTYAGLVSFYQVDIDPAMKTQRSLDIRAQVAADQAQLATTQIDSGFPAAAYDAATYATLLQLQANMEGMGMQILATQGEDGLVAFLEETSAVGASLESDLTALFEVEPENVSDVAALTNAYQFVVEGLGISITAEQTLGIEDISLEDVAAAIRLQAQATILGVAAADLLEIGSDLDSREISESTDPEKVADFFDSAADANMALFDSVVIPEIAAAVGVTEDQARQVLALKFPGYAVTVNAGNVIKTLEKEAESDPDAASLDYALLGAATSRYVNAADLIARFYSLDVQLDPEEFGIVTGFGSTDQLQAMFDVADKQTRSGIAELEANDVDPSPISMFYEMALFESADGGAEDQLTSLSTLWTAQLQSRILSYF